MEINYLKEENFNLALKQAITTYEKFSRLISKGMLIARIVPNNSKIVAEMIIYEKIWKFRIYNL